MSNNQPNEKRGEMKLKIGIMMVVIAPTFGRISRMEAALNRSTFELASGLAEKRGLTMMEMAIFFEQLSKPREKRDDIGNQLARIGYEKSLTLVGRVLEMILQGTAGTEQEEGLDDLPPEDDDEGKDQGED